MSNSVIIGLGFGDEGKGTLTDYLCSQFTNPLVIRYSGGHQAGHTVYLNDKKHVFSNFGAGTLRGIPTYWSKYCTVDPVGILNEFDDLEKININYLKLYIDPDCPITTPYDKLYNRTTELENLHGSCGIGFGATIEREKNHYSLTFSDLFYPDILNIKIKMIGEYYAKKTPGDKIISSDEYINFFNTCQELIKKFFIEKKVLEEIFCSDYIFEGAQGILLDQNMGFFPHVTRSNAGTKNILKIINSSEIDYYLITRAYQTRHGNGPMTNEERRHNIIENPEETNISRAWQGDFRRTLLDLDLLEYAINKDPVLRLSKNKTLVITCLDHVKLDHRFTYKGKIFASTTQHEFLNKIADILGIYQFLINDSPYSKTFKKLNL